MRKHKILIFIIIVVSISATLFCFMSQRDWNIEQGWSGVYNENSVLMEGLSGLELMCSTNTRIIYSYVINTGGAELKVTRDYDGKDIVKVVNITEENCNGIIILLHLLI